MIRLCPKPDLRRHCLLLHLGALLGILVLILARGMHTPLLSASTKTTPHSPPLNFQVRAQTTAPEAPASVKTEKAPFKPQPVKPNTPPTKQAGHMEKGEELPPLDLDIDAHTLEWLARRGQLLVLARSGTNTYKVLPGARGFQHPAIKRYHTADTQGLSTRAILLRENNPWGINLTVIRQRLNKRMPAARWQFEIRLGANLDRRAARAQRAHTKGMKNATTSIKIRIKDGKAAIQATGGATHVQASPK